VSEVANIFAATANPLQVIVAETENGRGVLGVIDGQPPLGVEGPEDRQWRIDFLRKIGYKR
jgi:adenosine/AMP kinase